MPAPSDNLEWATDTNFSNGPDLGTPTKVAPSAPYAAEGWVPGNKVPAQILNWWKNLAGQWQTWLEAERARLASYIGGADGSSEWAYPSARARVVTVAPEMGLAIRAQTTGGPAWTHQVFSVSPTQGFRLASLQDAARLVFPLWWFIPVGGEVTRIRSFVQPGAARSPGDRMQAFDFITNHDLPLVPNVKPGTVAYIGPNREVEDDGTTDAQVLDSGAFSYTRGGAEGGRNLVYQIVAGNDAGTNRDRVMLVQIFYNDPGPRNI